MNLRLFLRSIILRAATALLLAAASAAVGFPFVVTHPRIALLLSITAMGLGVMFIYDPLRRSLQPFLDRFFFANRYAYLETLRELPNDLLEFTNLREMLEFLIARLVEVAQLEQVRVFMHDPGRQSYVEMVFRGTPKKAMNASEGLTELPESAPLVKWLRHESRLWTLENLRETPEFTSGGEWKNLQEVGGAACFPINKEKELLGIVILGPKRSGDSFNAHDLRILRALRKRLENFLTQAMVLNQEALNMVKDAHDMKNDVNALKGRITWRATRLAAWWQEFEKELKHVEDTSDAHAKEAAFAILKKNATEFYADAQRSLPIEENAITRITHHLRNWAEFGRIVAEGFRGRRPQDAIDVGQTARLSIDRWKPIADKKNLDLSVQVEGAPLIAGERGLLEQIIENLVDNALQATEKGSVDVVCKQDHQDVLIEVRDTGTGIAADRLASLFDKPFYQDKTIEKLKSSSGVGLYLVAQYARSLGGRVSAESRQGEGSTFRVVLPALRKDPKSAEVAA